MSAHANSFLLSARYPYARRSTVPNESAARCRPGRGELTEAVVQSGLEPDDRVRYEGMSFIVGIILICPLDPQSEPPPIGVTSGTKCLYMRQPKMSDCATLRRAVRSSPLCPLRDQRWARIAHVG